jgi:hypothetical protein
VYDMTKKSDIYSWRLAAARKRELESVARENGLSVAALLDRMTSEWLSARRPGTSDEAVEQERLHHAARNTLGRIAGGEPHRAERARELVKKRIRARRAP